ncbi:hypothetical protein E4U42_006204 [Claviceps africana]|uniref:Bys1 family protein n=1 Tax=Claviceps africana TaxID=83212 RepID=A0A8K0J2Q2_9HYPO|nr:hypothetical protein E4U42_006204 [Claviceps africana]
MFGQAKALCLALAFTTAVSAVGNAVVLNNCTFPVTVWSVGSGVSPGATLQHGASYGEKFAQDPKTGGRALKVTRGANGLFSGEPQTVFAYTLKDAAVWYDLSDVFGDAFANFTLVVASADTACPAIVWPKGTPLAGSQVKNCGPEANVTLALCAN